MKKNTYKFISYIILFCLLLNLTFFSAIADNDTSIEAAYTTGLIWDDWETIEAHLDNSPVTYSTLPAWASNLTKFPLPDSQGQGSQGSCVAWAVGYALKSGQEHVKRDWYLRSDSHLFSPSYIFNQLNEGENSGITISEAMNLVVSQGTCPLTYFPYNENNYTSQPTAIQSAAAGLYKAASWNTIQGINEIKSRIANGDGVVIGICVYDNFYDLDEENCMYNTISGENNGGHAVCLIGYDDREGGFQFINSWGRDWGDNGFGWISYDFVNSATINNHGAGIGYVLNNTETDNYCMGDVTGDGNVTAADARLILQFSSSSVTLSPNQYVLGDVNGDSQVTASDAQAILQYSSGAIDKLPIYE